MVEVLQQETRMELRILIIIEETIRHIQEQVHFIMYQLILSVQDVMQHLLIIMVLHHNSLHTLLVENI